MLTAKIASRSGVPVLLVNERPTPPVIFRGPIAIARRQEDGFTSVYVGTFWVPAALLANIAREAGCHLYAEPGTVVTTDGRVMAVASETGGTEAITLPRATNASDALNGNCVADNADRFELEMRPGECRLLGLASSRKVC
jgi:hypothetical protein